MELSVCNLASLHILLQQVFAAHRDLFVLVFFSRRRRRCYCICLFDYAVLM